MPDKTKTTVVMACSVIGCIVTLLTCGVLIGNLQANDNNQAKQIAEIAIQQKTVVADVSDIKEEQAFQKGVVTTQLATQGSAIVRIEKKLDDLVRVD
jgi:hypothetical protein